ncbi:bifunctional diguanylate cyclase/phosphodiesterase [Modestobacter sp. Leaf380]|uniref:putative bifunctional diguanylate cyclase/phosphodiesterase n=1 Tax=Modestobacter sp. Leaf380 TaxID=1736356 RepID=UPI0006FA852C|nr:bifunctional diguanylate cyclase/phosphodiesterase [Modestobacter sp. Leaf380]KQS73687.1 hypothetical protein ASG41_03530 [Modestobacter sp. Leaf380]
MRSPLPRPAARRGVPLAVHLTALVLVPVLGLLALGWVLVAGAVHDSRSAAAAEESVRAVALLDTVRSSIEQEVIPVLTTAVLASPETLAELGLTPAFAAMAGQQAQAAVETTRQATDDALDAVAADSPAAGPARQAAAALEALRAPGAAGTVVFADVLATYEGYLRLSDQLGADQQDAGAGAGRQDVSADTRAAVADVALVARASQAASREIPLFLSTMTDLDEQVGEDTWITARADYRSAAQALADLTDPDLAAAWADTAALTAVRGIDDALESQLLPGATPLVALQMLTLVTQNAERSVAFGALLDTAVGTAVDAAGADRAAADRARDTTLQVGAALLAVSAGAVVWVGRSVSRSLGRLADRAQEVSRGSLVDVEVSGPREVRTVSAALQASVASLRRIQDQAGAVAAGDLDHALLAEPLPGPLGEVVHASVQQIVTSVREREELQSALAHQAAHDPLTELPNRAQARRLLTSALHRAQRSGAAIGLLFVDLDGFKAVNDGFGHAAGDHVLRTVAGRLHDGVRSGDVVCRLGGDEFVVLLEPVDGEEALLELSARLIEAVSAPITVGGATMAVGASIGVAVSRDAGTDGDALLAQADAAVYRAKAHGRGRAELFDEALRAQLVERAELQAAIAAGLAAGEMRLDYQPVCDVVSGALIGYEALIRWDRPGHGVVQPDAFIAAAEASRLICQLDRWVLHEATRQLAEWRTGTGPVRPGEPTVAVNISGRHLSDSRVVTDVVDALTASGLPAGLLVVEITETVLVDDPAAYAHLAALRDLGVGIAIDDFGTGYTSIGQLRHMPVDTVKIDRSFIASDEPSHRTLVALMIQSAHAFGLTVVAEGVEDPAQLARLQADSCDLAQGYLLARPLGVQAAHAMLLAGRQDTTIGV